jgi:hypothetical protein
MFDLHKKAPSASRFRERGHRAFYPISERKSSSSRRQSSFTKSLCSAQAAAAGNHVCRIRRAQYLFRARALEPFMRPAAHNTF